MIYHDLGWNWLTLCKVLCDILNELIHVKKMLNYTMHLLSTLYKYIFLIINIISVTILCKIHKKQN